MNSRKLIGKKMNIFPRYLFFLFRFARLAANTFISQGVPVYLFSDIIPTPFVVGILLYLFITLSALNVCKFCQIPCIT